MQKKSQYKWTKKLFGIVFVTILMFSCKLSVDTVEAASVTDENGKQVNTITSRVVTSGDKVDANKYTQHTIVLPTAEKQVIIPVELSKSGYYKLGIEVADNYGVSGYISAKLYSDADCTKSLIGIHPSIFLNQGTSNFGYMSISKAGTYYLKLSASSELCKNYESISIKLKGNLFNGDNRTLTSNKYTTTYRKDSRYVYYKVNVKKTGYITVKQNQLVQDNSGTFVIKEEDTSSYVALCNSKKKELTPDCYNSYKTTKNKQIFGVKKGTYYLKVKAYLTNPYRIKYTFKALTDQSGSSQKSAKTIKSGSRANGLVLATDKTSKVDWYKFYLPKKQNVSISIFGDTCNTSGSIRVQIIPPKKVILFGDTFSAGGTGFKKAVKSKDKFNAGTYYLKVTKTNDNVTGHYTITVK
ncbi:hypothetical protein [Velocimicrobium porci]|uniref:Peptidase C-terminal archaeal/bacterial domain-containing protein n=1 Tax=Velocimicrobium porci TaxID=2606634 RepID=A0A6L5Y0F5_9FIRM|nr:hypothetical protein [Velocimicrobium porci]MSS64545.1 hypothetical protein [Velocimicrobium porci]